ncbi:MAG: hypothetical protein ABFS35_22750 [Bacteroidota bacterium]
MKKNYYNLIKHIAISSFLSFVLLSAKGQENKVDFIINGQLTQIIGKGDSPYNNILIDYIWPKSAGPEFFIELKTANNFSISAGAGYCWGQFETENIIGHGVEFRLKYHELNVPLLIRRDINQKYFVSVGLYSGWLIKGTIQNNRIGTGWFNISELSDRYNDEKFTMDLYMDFGKQQTISEKQKILFFPFVKYKLKDYWMGQFRSRFQYGIKISYFIKL